MSILICFVFLWFVCVLNRVLFSFSDGAMAALLESEEDEDDDVPLVLRR